MKNHLPPYEPHLLPAGVCSRFLEANGLRMHILEAGFEEADRPLVLLLHGFPELAYTWRHNLLPLARMGYHVVAPDLRGFGRTTGWERGYETDLVPFAMPNQVADMVALTMALGYDQVYAVVGHDSGSMTAAHAALLRPDMFRRLVMMAAPFGGLPKMPGGGVCLGEDFINQSLAALARQRKHYHIYYTTEEAAAHLDAPPQGIHDFLRAYFHCKSADWEGNSPHRLDGWRAEVIQELPTYYIMDLDATMPESVAPYMPREEQIQSCTWLTEAELAVYSGEFSRTGFQGGLNLYRCSGWGLNDRLLAAFAGQQIRVPALFIAGDADWCPYQRPGSLEAMSRQVCRDFRGIQIVPGAGHWVQQEQPEKTNALLLAFLKNTPLSGEEIGKGK